MKDDKSFMSKINVFEFMWDLYKHSLYIYYQNINTLHLTFAIITNYRVVYRNIIL